MIDRKSKSYIKLQNPTVALGFPPKPFEKKLSCTAEKGRQKRSVRSFRCTRMRRKRPSIEPEVVPVQYARAVPVEARSAIAKEIVHHILYSRNQLPCPVLRLPATLAEAASDGGSRRKGRYRDSSNVLRNKEKATPSA
eukprot:scaffold7514_cov239-Pinguiococcus_pyrenoidosus.AAC.2